MAEELIIPESASRPEIYQRLLPQVRALFHGEKNLIANAANLAAVLKEAFGFLWVGFYFVDKNELVLGPFQGPIACTRIKFGAGVCGAAWSRKTTIIVPDVDLFPGHISCNSKSKSEIVIPLFDENNQVVGVLDVDSDLLNDFDETDRLALEQWTQLLMGASVA